MQGHLNAIRAHQLDYLQSLSLEDWNSIQNEWKIPAGHMIVMENGNCVNPCDGDDEIEGTMKMIEVMNSKEYDLTTTANIVCYFYINPERYNFLNA